MKFIVLFEDAPDAAPDIRQVYMQRHLAFLESHSPRIEAAGPLDDPDNQGRNGLWIVDAASKDEIEDLIAWAHADGHDVTLIEVMPLGDIEEERLDQYLRLDEVKARLERRWTLNANDANTGGPARYWDIPETGGRLGLITPHTGNFCEGCNRLRVTATGQLYPCLGGAERVDLRAALRSENPDKEVAEALNRALMIKPEKHHFRMDERGAAPHLPRHMSMTGG